MRSLVHAYELVKSGETVTIVPRGNSMVGLVPDRSEVVVAPADTDALESNDVVLVRVGGQVYLHRILTLDRPRRRALIGNNRGGTNGWTPLAKVVGIAVRVNGVERNSAVAKVRR